VCLYLPLDIPENHIREYVPPREGLRLILICFNRFSNSIREYVPPREGLRHRY